MMRKFAPLLCLVLLAACQSKVQYEKIIRNGMIYDGNGGQPFKGDIAINADTIAAIGELTNAVGKDEIDAKGMAVAPGFINMMGHSEDALIQDGKSQGDIRQGVTTEIFGEFSMGPLNPTMKKQMQEGQTDIKYEVQWNTLGE
jgi:N-acyl-D-amino-acid deacylase